MSVTIQQGRAIQSSGTWSPSYSAGSGSLTTVTTTNARYVKTGRSVTLSLDFAVTNRGTADPPLFIGNLPYPLASGAVGSCAFREKSATGLAFTGTLTGTAIEIWRYDNGNPCVTGYSFSLSITYETDS